MLVKTKPISTNPPANLVKQIDAYYPLSIKYVKKREQIALSQGVLYAPTAKNCSRHRYPTSRKNTRSLCRSNAIT
ncbi:hypothetical protein OK016_18310 [Vibrio chagasii]|nr:hypothetical protein [Vibrio chagasii]